MNETGYYGAMLLVGMGLGAVFLGGLWLTVKMVATTRHPVLLTLGSVVLRIACVLTGVWYFSGGDALGIVFCVIGLGAMRVLATHGALFPVDDRSHAEIRPGGTSSAGTPPVSHSSAKVS